jgi:hypothetical protein
MFGFWPLDDPICSSPTECQLGGGRRNLLVRWIALVALVRFRPMALQNSRFAAVTPV